MFNWLLPEKHAISILKKDHDAVKDIFDQFKKAESPSTRKSLIHKAVNALKIHALIEEELFYPAVRPQVGDILMNEADEEHHVAKLLIAELDQSESDDHRDAKFTVLAEGVRHHIKEEEGQIFPEARAFDIDFEMLGRRMMDRKKELLEIGIPSDAEHNTVASAAGNTDSPAAMARQRKSSGAGRRKTSSPDSRTTKRQSPGSREKEEHMPTSTDATAKRKIHKVMKEKKEGTLRSSSGQKVTSRKQAVAIALSEARRAGGKVPSRKSS